jgi:hypothetical protein
MKPPASKFATGLGAASGPRAPSDQPEALKHDEPEYGVYPAFVENEVVHDPAPTAAMTIACSDIISFTAIRD